MRRLLSSAALGFELGALAWVVYRQAAPDGPELGELARRTWAELVEFARYRAAVEQTLQAIRRLPEVPE